MDLQQWAALDKEHYNSLFKNSPVKRAGFDKLKASLALIQKK